MNCVVLANTLDLEVNEKVFVRINGNTFGPCKVVDSYEESVCILLDEESLKFINYIEYTSKSLGTDVQIDYFLIRIINK